MSETDTASPKSAPGQAREFTDRALAAAGDVADEKIRDLVLADLGTIPGQPRYW